MATAIVKKDSVQTIRELLQRNASQIRLALPKHIDPDRMQRAVLTACLQTPKLYECTQQSMMLSVLRAAQMGLEPDGIDGYLLPYGTQAQFLPSYRGLVKLARQSGEIATVVARVVHEGDRFDWSLGTNEKIDHVPALADADDDTPPRLIYVYAVATFKGGDKQFEVMSRAQVDAVRSRSRAKDSGPWVTDYEEMAKKTVVRRLSKLLPLSTQLQRVLAEEEAIDRGAPLMDVDLKLEVADEPKPSRLEALTKAKAPQPVQDAVEVAPPAAARHDGPDTNALRARALMGEQDAIDELQSMGVEVGALADINVDRLSKELGERYRAWLSQPKGGAR